MLDTLADLDRERATNVLASAARSLSRRTFASDVAELAERPDEDDPIVGAVIQELERTVSRRRDEGESRYLARLSEKLSGAITAYFLRGTDPENVRARAGDKGTLPNSMYRVSLSQHFNAQTKLFAIKKAHVEGAIKHADMVQHLSGQIPLPGTGVSLFVRTPRIQGSPYTILARCSRLGASLFVEDVLRIYHDEFDLSELNTPMDMLKIFLQRFGIPITIEGVTGNPIFQKKITVPNDSEVEIILPGKTFKHKLPDQQAGKEMDIILNYAFDQKSYASYQRQYGVASKEVGDISTFTHFASMSYML
jgi:hypothetical protein